MSWIESRPESQGHRPRFLIITCYPSWRVRMVRTTQSGDTAGHFTAEAAPQMIGADVTADLTGVTLLAGQRQCSETLRAQDRTVEEGKRLRVRGLRR